jgi:cytoskeletal protein CcmA (bactofilin family)
MEPSEREEEKVSVIGPGLIVEGDVAGTGAVDLHVEGEIRGDVACRTLVLAPGGKVTGRVRANRALLAGTVAGGAEAEDLAIEAGAAISGGIVYERLRIEEGAIVKGDRRRRAPPFEGSRLRMIDPGEEEE